MPPRVTITQIANTLQLNAATVSRALNGSLRISEATRKRVHQKATELRYQRDNIASSLKSGRTHTIGVMIPSAGITFFGSVVHGIEALATEEGFQVLLYQSDERQEKEAKGLQAFINARVDGVLASLAKGSTTFDHYHHLVDLQIPLVFFDRAPEGFSTPAVLVNDFQGGYDATTELIRQGYGRIVHIAGPQHLNVFRDRLRGYRTALEDAGLHYDKTMVLQGDITVATAAVLTNRFLQWAEPPDAVFAAEDYTAMGVFQAIRAAGLRMPEDFGLIGFANEEFGRFVTPTLSTMDQQTAVMGREACRLLLSLIRKETEAPSALRSVLPVLPVYRESSAKLSYPQQTNTTIKPHHYDPTIAT